MTPKQEFAMAREADRVREMLAEAVANIEGDDGNLRYFSAMFLRAAIELQIETEGPAATARNIAAVGERQLARTGAAGAC